ncbi:MAG: ATP synthase F1 subunit delta [Syntrophales bacterium]|nr:ATP synthase F1 subunit delta [Syntrophales bacterium]
MNGGNTVAKRYAKAFFEVAEEQGRIEKFYEELSVFLSLIQENKDFREFLANPIFDQHEKRVVVDTVLGMMSVSDVTANFLRLLTDKRRIVLLKEIVDSYRDMMDEALGIVRIGVMTAFPLTDELRGELQSKLEMLTGKRVVMTVVEDRSLLGGIVVRIGDTVYDNSVRTQLNNIRNLLWEER